MLSSNGQEQGSHGARARSRNEEEEACHTPVSTLSHEKSLQRGYRMTRGLPDTLAPSVPTTEQRHVNAVLCTLHLRVLGLSRGSRR